MQTILFEDYSRTNLLPFSFTRAIYDLRSGIFTFRERWQHLLKRELKCVSASYLQSLYPSPLPHTDSLWINGKFVPNIAFLELIQEAEPNTFYTNSQNEVLLIRSQIEPVRENGLISTESLRNTKLKEQKTTLESFALRQPWEIFQWNKSLIEFDFPIAANLHTATKIQDPYTRIYGADNLFVAEGTKVRAAIINAEDGPVFLGPNTQIQEGAILHGAHALYANVTVSMGAKLRGDSSFGPFVKVGGEVGNSVIMGYSNKGHEGYLGNSVLGYWCNLGADTNTSNLKNNYAPVRLWNYQAERFVNTGLQFCGLMMGDHSKCGINTMFNTGTVVGVAANIFGADYPRNFIPSFSWGGKAKITTFRMPKVLEMAERVMQRRNKQLSKAEKQVLQHIFEQTAIYRRWE